MRELLLVLRRWLRPRRLGCVPHVDGGVERGHARGLVRKRGVRALVEQDLREVEVTVHDRDEERARLRPSADWLTSAPARRRASTDTNVALASREQQRSHPALDPDELTVARASSPRRAPPARPSPRLHHLASASRRASRTRCSLWSLPLAADSFSASSDGAAPPFSPSEAAALARSSRWRRSSPEESFAVFLVQLGDVDESRGDRDVGTAGCEQLDDGRPIVGRGEHQRRFASSRLGRVDARAVIEEALDGFDVSRRGGHHERGRSRASSLRSGRSRPRGGAAPLGRCRSCPRGTKECRHRDASSPGCWRRHRGASPPSGASPLSAAQWSADIPSPWAAFTSPPSFRRERSVSRSPRIAASATAVGLVARSFGAAARSKSEQIVARPRVLIWTTPSNTGQGIDGTSAQVELARAVAEGARCRRARACAASRASRSPSASRPRPCRCSPPSSWPLAWPARNRGQRLWLWRFESPMERPVEDHRLVEEVRVSPPGVFFSFSRK